MYVGKLKGKKKNPPIILVSDIAQSDFITLRGSDEYGPVPR